MKGILIPPAALLISALPLLAGGPTVMGTDNGTLLTCPNGQTFTIPPSKGLLGPSTNPTAQVPFSNADYSIIAANEEDVVEDSIIHIYIKGSDGKYTELQNVNDKIEHLIPPPLKKWNTDFIRVERIQGRIVEIGTIDFSKRPLQQHNFKLRVSADGSLSPARQQSSPSTLPSH